VKGKLAYLSQVKSGGKQYIYLTEYKAMQEYSTKTEQHVFSFGQAPKALVKMKYWIKYFEDFPEELKQQGFTKKDLEKWIETLKTGVTPSGRKFVVDTKKRAVF